MTGLFQAAVRAHYPELAARCDLLAEIHRAGRGVVDVLAADPGEAARLLEALSAILVDAAERMTVATALGDERARGAGSEHALCVAITNALLVGVWAAQRGLARVPERGCG